MVSSFRFVVLPAVAGASECTSASSPATCLSFDACAWLMLEGRCEASDSAEALASPPSCCSSTAPNSMCAHRSAELPDGLCTAPFEDRSWLGLKESFDRTYATRMAHLSGAAYCPEALVSSWACGEHCSAVQGLQLLQYIKNEKEVLAGFVAWDSSLGAIVVSFRGTVQSITDWVHNIAFTKTKPFDQYPDVGVHHGFWGSWLVLKPEVLAAIQNIQQSHAGARVVVTGHSLGGAIASDAALDLSLNHGLTTSVVNFGAPRAGDSGFSNLLKQHVPSYWRVTHNKDLVPHVPPQHWGFYHAATEVFFNEEQTEYQVCDGSGEDPSCSDQCAKTLSCTSVPDHTSYYGVAGDCASPDDEDEDDEPTQEPTQEPTIAPEDPTTEEPTVAPVDPETTMAPQTTMAPETTIPPGTTVAPDPSLTLKECRACLMMCAPCQACAEGSNATFLYGSCDKCWHCWNWGKDKLKDDDKHMDKDCDAMHHDHDWSSHKVRCLTDFPKSSKVTSDCRPCWATFGNAMEDVMLV